ncbi:MAG: fluoride efflux transporter CrcB [Thainema sp.]
MLENPAIRAPIAISLGAIAGALCRYVSGQWLGNSIDINFPIGTLLINLSGCFLMGLITTLATRRFSFHPELFLLMTTGFLGAYTTFSSYELDSANLLEARNLQADFIYWIGSPILGFLCFALGTLLARQIETSRSQN